MDDSDDARRERSERQTPPMGGVDWLDARLHVLEKILRQSEAARVERAEKAAVDRAMLLGVDGQPGGRLGIIEGRLTVIEQRLAAGDERLTKIETWRTGLTAKIAVGIAIGTPIAGVITAIVVKFLVP